MHRITQQLSAGTHTSLLRGVAELAERFRAHLRHEEACGSSRTRLLTMAAAVVLALFCGWLLHGWELPWLVNAACICFLALIGPMLLHRVEAEKECSSTWRRPANQGAVGDD